MSIDQVEDLESTGDWEGAERLWQDVVAADRTAWTLFRLGRAAAKAGHIEAATEALLAALEVDLNLAPARFELAFVYLDQDRLKEAAE